MDNRRFTESRLALIGLTVLVVITLLLFVYLFFGFTSLFSGDSDKPSGTNTDSSTEDSPVDSDQNALLIADLQAKMNGFQTQLNSPYLLLVNEANPIPEDYDPELSALDGEFDSFELEASAADKMNEFLRAASNSGYSVTISAAYRTEEEQRKAYNNAVQDYMKAGYPVDTASSMAAMKVGSVNCSEHQLGFAVDFSSKTLTSTGISDGTTFEQYLTRNIYKYGFVLSYPAGEEEQTGHEANTSHYRYVGVEAAEVMSANNWVLSEYRDYLQSQIDYLKQTIESYEKK